MRPLFLTRAASSKRRMGLRAILLIALPAALLLTACLAHAQVRYLSKGLSEQDNGPVINESPVQPYEVGQLFKRWESTERQHYGRELLPEVAEMAVRARIRGVTTLEVLPLLMVVEADVTHHVAGGRDCSAGADSYARLMQTAKTGFLTNDAKVRETAERLGKAYAGCDEARKTITQVASSGLAGVLVTGAVDSTRSAAMAEDRGRRAAAELTGAPVLIQELPPAHPWLHAIEEKVTGWVISLGGEPLASALVAAPWLDPDSPDFKRFLWWGLLVLVYLGGSQLYQAVTAGVTNTMAPKHAAAGTSAKSASTGTPTLSRNRSTRVVRHKR